METRKKLIEMLEAQLKDYSDVIEGLVYLPEVNEFLKVSEGSGDNLDYEDEQEGYVDYIYLENYVMLPEEYDYRMVSQDYTITVGESGLLMLKELYGEKYKGKFAEAIVDSIEFSYPNNDITMAFYIAEPSVVQIRKFEKMSKLFDK